MLYHQLQSTDKRILKVVKIVATLSYISINSVQYYFDIKKKPIQIQGIPLGNEAMAIDENIVLNVLKTMKYIET